MGLGSVLASGEALDVSGEFKQAYELLNNSSKNFFVTGKAGTGKSTLLRYFVENTHKTVAIVAPTGIAAINVGGFTINSFFMFKPQALREEDIQRVYTRGDLYTSLDTLIIDEISMVRSDMMNGIDKFLRLNRGKSGPFGGVQVIAFGDVFQLPPVVTTKEETKYMEDYFGSKYFFDAPVFRKHHIHAINLKKVFRQKDKEFIELLDSVRMEKATAKQLEKFNERHIPDFTPPEDEFYITLSSRKKDAGAINKQQLGLLDEELFEHEAVITGQFKASAYPTSKHLQLKPGAQVMFVKNDTDKRWVNGTIGRVDRIDDETVYVAIVSEDSGVEQVVDVGLETWEVIGYDYDKESKKLTVIVVGTFKQYPLRLAWAITIHKSQGLTFDNVIVDLGKDGAFDYGQTYVALSRCTTFEGLVLARELRHKDIAVDPLVLRFYTQNVDLSEMSDQEFKDLEVSFRELWVDYKIWKRSKGDDFVEEFNTGEVFMISNRMLRDNKQLRTKKLLDGAGG